MANLLDPRLVLVGTPGPGCTNHFARLFISSIIFYERRLSYSPSFSNFRLAFLENGRDLDRYRRGGPTRACSYLFANYTNISQYRTSNRRT